MEDEKRNLQYYLQDDLGSPLRVLYRNGYGEAYGYDEFGTELYESDSIKEEKTRKKYGKQGENQPFGYTGYRYDNISGSYFAQAREYMPEVGRFISEDIIKGTIKVPTTLNHYNYCWDNPLIFLDLDGKEPDIPEETENNDYEGVYYLNSQDGAYTFGHAAMMFKREDGSGTFYSFAASTSEAINIVLGNDVEGYLSKAELSADDVTAFFSGNLDGYTGTIVEGSGKLNTDGIDGDFLDGAENPYTRAIYIPITSIEGKAMTYYAEYLRECPGQYNLYARNCGMVVQEILQKGGKNFAVLPGAGKQLDEQIALINMFKGFATLHPGKSSGILLGHLAKDYFDQTIPDAAYHFGWIMTQTIMWKFGWEAGKLNQFAQEY